MKITKDKFRITVSTMPGDWDTCSDPGSAREMTSMKPAADKDPESYSGDISYDDLTLTRLWEEARDSAIVDAWDSSRGLADMFEDVTVGLTTLGIDKVAIGRMKPYVGKVQAVKRSGSDANASDRAKLEIVVKVDRAA